MGASGNPPPKGGKAMVELGMLFRRTKGKTGSAEPGTHEQYSKTKERVELSLGGSLAIG